VLPDGWSLETLVRRCQVLASCEKNGYENVVRVITKFIEGESKVPQKAVVALARWDRRRSGFVSKGYHKGKQPKNSAQSLQDGLG
jgi:hypothetical protein